MEAQELKAISRKIKSRFTTRHLNKLLEVVPDRYEQRVVIEDIPSHVKLLNIVDKESVEGRGRLIINVEVNDRKGRKYNKDIRIFYRDKNIQKDYLQIESYGWITEDKLGYFLDKDITFYILFTESLGFKDKTAIPVYI